MIRNRRRACSRTAGVSAHNNTKYERHIRHGTSTGNRVRTSILHCMLVWLAALAPAGVRGAESALIITGVLDAPASSTFQVLEVVATEDIPDLSIYSIRVLSNGQPADYPFPNIIPLSGSATAGQFLYATPSQLDFRDFFGFDADFVTTAFNFNGDDVIAILLDGAFVDVFGVIGVDGSGQNWEYTDTWAYRADHTGPNTAFVVGEWSFAPGFSTRSASTNSGLDNPMPIGSYVFSSNADPVAAAGPDQQVPCEAPDGAVVLLNGAGSGDPDGDALTFEWSVPNGVLLDDPASATTLGLFPIGVTTATLTVTDGNGGIDVDDVVITVFDEMPPEVASTTSVAALWPPNHQMVPVAVAVYATDACSSPADLQLLAVVLQSNEPDDVDGPSDGETTGDTDGDDGYSATVDVTGAFVFNPDSGAFEGWVMLRAERADDGFGRSYSVSAAVRDTAGNIAETSCVVVVPHDGRGKK